MIVVFVLEILVVDFGVLFDDDFCLDDVGFSWGELCWFIVLMYCVVLCYGWCLMFSCGFVRLWCWRCCFLCWLVISSLGYVGCWVGVFWLWWLCWFVWLFDCEVLRYWCGCGFVEWYRFCDGCWVMGLWGLVWWRFCYWFVYSWGWFVRNCWWYLGWWCWLWVLVVVLYEGWDVVWVLMLNLRFDEWVWYLGWWVWYWLLLFVWWYCCCVDWWVDCVGVVLYVE